MAEPRYDVVGIGNAIVDVLAETDDAFIQRQGLNKGTMTLIDADVADRLYAAMPRGVECSGGSCANTIASLASLGGRGAYIGKVKDDKLGQAFSKDIRNLGVAFETAPATDGPSTARCLVMVTPDAHRTMQTYLGACVNLGPNDIDPAMIADGAVTYLEGYLWDPPMAKEAFLKAAGIAHGAGRMVSLSLSDPFCVARHREDFLKLVSEHVDVLFANETEIMSLYGTETFDAALQRVRRHCKIAVLTRSERGAVVLSGDEVHVIDAEKVVVKDTTGAGDSYAAGFLYGITHGYSLGDSGRIGAIAAAEVISHFGARPETSLKTLVERKLD